jgi:mannose-6-phosphate isomerase-like protein (cupin superfamily)
MNLRPGEDIPGETHNDVTQVIKPVSGKGLAMVQTKPGSKIYETYKLNNEVILIIPPRHDHYIVNPDIVDLKLYSWYAPPEHPHDRVDKYPPGKNK